MNASSGSPAKQLARERRGGALRERTRLERKRGRVSEDLRQEVGLAALLRRARRDEHAQRHALEAGGEVAEPAQRRGVRPVEVVDDEQRRRPRTDVRGEPVEAVEHREADVLARVERSGELGLVEEALGERGRPCEEVRALGFGRGRENRLEELADDAVAEVLLELGASCEEHL